MDRSGEGLGLEGGSFLGDIGGACGCLSFGLDFLDSDSENPEHLFIILGETLLVLDLLDTGYYCRSLEDRRDIFYYLKEVLSYVRRNGSDGGSGDGGSSILRVPAVEGLPYGRMSGVARDWLSVR
jgi:hypothetical protein